MATQHNPACEMETYHGGLHCCKHQWFLTDESQGTDIPDLTDEYVASERSE